MTPVLPHFSKEFKSNIPTKTSPSVRQERKLPAPVSTGPRGGMKNWTLKIEMRGIFTYLVVEPTHLKSMLVKLDHFPKQGWK